MPPPPPPPPLPPSPRSRSPSRSGSVSPPLPNETRRFPACEGARSAYEGLLGKNYPLVRLRRLEETNGAWADYLSGGAGASASESARACEPKAEEEEAEDGEGAAAEEEEEEEEIERKPLVLLGDAPLPIEGQLPLPTDAPRSLPPQVAPTAAAMAPPYGIQDVLLPVHVKMELSPPPSTYSDDYHHHHHHHDHHDHHHDHPERPEAESSPPPPQMLRSRDDDSTSLCGSTSDSSQFMGFDPEYLPQPIYEDISDPEDGEPPHHRGPRFARENDVVLQFAPNVVARPAAGSLGGALCERLRHLDDGDDDNDVDDAGHRGEEVPIVKSEPDLDVSFSDPIEVELKRMFNSPTPPPPPPPVPCSSPLPALARCSPSPPSSASSTRSLPPSSVSPRPPPTVEDESSSVLVDSGGPSTLCCLLSSPLPPCSSSTPSPPPCPYTTPPSPCPSTHRPSPSTTPPCSSTTPLCPSTSSPCPSASPPTLHTPTSSVQYESPTHTPQPLPPPSSPPIQTSARSPCSSSLCSLSPAVITSVFSSVVQSPSLHSAAYQSRPTPSSASSPSPPLPPMLSPHTPPSLPSPSPPYSPPTPPPPSQCSLTSQTCPSKPGPSGENFFLNKEDIPTGDSCTCKSLSIEKRRKSAPELSIPLPVIQLRRKERASSWTYADSDFNAVDKSVVESKVGNYFQRLKFTRANSVWKVLGCENCNRDTNCKSPSKLSEPSEMLVDLGQCSKTMHEVGYLSDDNTGVCQEHNKCDFETQSKAVLSVCVKDTQSDKDKANVDISYDEETQLNISGDNNHDNSVTDGCVVKDSINTLTKSISDMCNTNETCEVISKRDTVCDINEKTSIVQNPKRPVEDDVNSRDTSSYSDSSKIQSKDCECEDISETEIKSGEENVTGSVADIQANGDRKKEIETGNQDFIKENNCNNEYEDDEDNEGELKIDEDRLSGDENEQKVIREVEISPKAKAENSLELLNCKFQNSIKKKLEPENKGTIDVIELSDDELESNQSPNVKKGADSITNSISRVHVIQSPKCIASHVKKSTESSEDKKMISGSECTQDKLIMKDKELSIRSDSETGDSTTSVLEGDSAKPHEENYTMLNEKTDSIQEIVVSEEIESQKVLASGNEQSVVTEPSAVKRKLVKNDDVGIPLKSRKLRPSRRNFRHDNIKMFKVSSVKPTPPPWMYQRKSLSAEKQEKSLSATTQSSGASADKHIGSVNESSGNEGSSETRNKEVSKGKRRHSLEHSELLKLKKVCRSASDASDESQQPHGNEMSVEDKDEKEEKDEGLKDSKRKKRKSLGEQSVLEEVSKQFVSHQMQEKGRRLAQEIPGFNWLEEKIRSGGVPMNKPHVKRSSTETQSSSLTKEVISDEDGSKTNGPSESSVQVTGGSDENSSSKGPSQSIVINTGSIATVQQNRAPVIVSTRQLGNIPERMDPLLKQLTSGGDLEITISRQTNQGSEMSSPRNESDANEPSAIVIPATTVSTNGTTETVPVTITFPTTFQGSQAIVTSSTSVPTISQTSPFIVSALQGSVPNVLNSVDTTQRLRVLSVPQERVPQTNGTENRLNVSLSNSGLEQRPAVDLHPNIQILPPNAAPLSNAVSGRRSPIVEAGLPVDQVPQRGASRGQRGGRRGRGWRGTSRQTNAATESREQAALSSQSYNFPPYSSTHMSADNYNFSQPSSHTSQSSLQHHYFQQTALNVGLHPSHHSHLPHAQSSRNAQGPLVNEVPQPLQQTNQIFREQLVSQPPQLVRLPQPHNASNSAQLGNLHQQSPSIQLTSQVVENNARVQQMPPLSQPVISSQQSRYSTFYPSISSFSRIPESHNHSQSLHFHRPQMPHLPSSSAQVAHPHVSEPVGLSASTQLPPLLPLSQTTYPALPPLQPQFTQAAPDHQAAVRDPTSHLQNEARHNDYLASLRMQQNLMRRNLHLNPHQYNSIHSNDLQYHPQSNQRAVYPTNSLPRSTSHLPTERDFPSLPEYLRLNNHPGQIEQGTLAAQSRVTSQSSFIPPHQSPLIPQQPSLLPHPPPHQSSHSSHQPLHLSPHQSPHTPHLSPHQPHQFPHLSHPSRHLPHQSHLSQQPPHLPYQSPHLPHQPPHLHQSHLPHQVPHLPHQSPHLPHQPPHLPHQPPHLPHQPPHLPHQPPHLPHQPPHLPHQPPHLPHQPPHLPHQSPHLPRQSPHLPRQSPHLPQQSHHPPQQSPHPPQQSPHPPQQSPHPPQQSPRPPQQSPHPPQHSPRPPQQSPRPPQQSPRPPQQSPRPPQQSPLPPQQSPHPPQQSPRLPQQSPPPQQSLQPPQQSSQHPHFSQQPQQSTQIRHQFPQLQQSYSLPRARLPPYPHLPPRPYLPPPQSQSYYTPPATEQPFPPPLLLIQPQSNAQQMLGRQMLSSGQEETRTQPAPKSPNSDYSDCLATMARHAAAAVDTGLGTGLQPPVYQNERIRSQIPATTAAAHLPTSSQRFCDVTYASRPQPGRPTAHPENQGGQNASARERPAVSSSQAHVPVTGSNENNKRSAVCEQTSRVGGIDENASDEDIESLERLRHITNKEIEKMPKCLNEVHLAFNETARNLEKEGLLPAGTKDIAQQSAPHHRVTFQHTPVNGATLSAAQTSRSSTVSAHASSVLPSHSSDYSVEQQTPIFRESRAGPACTSSIRSGIVPDTVEVPVTLKLKHSVASTDRTENKTTLTAEAAVTENVTASSVASITARTSTSAVDVTCPETFITVTAAAPAIAVGTAMSRLTTATAVVPGGTITASSENIKESRMPMAKYAVLPHVGPSTSSSLENRNEQNTSLMVFNRELPNRDIAQIQNSGRGAIQIPHSTECTVDGSVGGEESAVPISISSDSRNERSTLVSVDDQNTRRRLSNAERYSDINESPLDLSVGSQRPKEFNEPVTRRQQVSDSASSVSSLEEHRNLPTVPTDRHVCAADIQNDFSQLRKHLLSKNAPLAASSESFPELEIVEETYPPDPKHQDLNSISNRILGEDTLSTKRNCSTETAVPLGPHAVCVLCRRSALFVCSLCNQTKYCSKYCQGSHWMFHKRYCTRV